MKYENKEQVDKIFKTIDGYKNTLDELTSKNVDIVLESKAGVEIILIETDVSDEEYREEGLKFIEEIKTSLKRKIEILKEETWGHDDYIDGYIEEVSSIALELLKLRKRL